MKIEIDISGAITDVTLVIDNKPYSYREFWPGSNTRNLLIDIENAMEEVIEKHKEVIVFLEHS